MGHVVINKDLHVKTVKMGVRHRDLRTYVTLYNYRNWEELGSKDQNSQRSVFNDQEQGVYSHYHKMGSDHQTRGLSKQELEA